MPRRVSDEGERSGRLSPGRVRRSDTSSRPFTGTALNLLRLARLVSRSSNGALSKSPSFGFRGVKTGSPFQRRCIVNVRYANGRTPGGWKAHGKYLERDSAREDSPAKEDAGFVRDEIGTQSDLGDRLGLAKDQSLTSLADSWQKAGDQRIFKIIVSPEDSQANLAATATHIVAHIEKHIGTPVEWGGVIHRNTEHSHAHLIIRGWVRSGDALKLPPEMIRNGLRQAAQVSITRHLGPRSIEEIQLQRRAELTVNRATSLDRKIVREASGYPDNPTFLQVRQTASAAERARLGHLLQVGLAKSDPRDGWLVQADTVRQLRQMKDLQDRARILFRSGVAISDPRAPMEYSYSTKKLVGRVLLNSEDERTGALQTVFETTENKIEILRHDSTLRAAWARGDLQPGNVVVIDSLRTDPSKLYASLLGRDARMLTDSKALDSLTRRMRTMGLHSVRSEKGWLGELSRALQKRTMERHNQRGF